MVLKTQFRVCQGVTPQKLRFIFLSNQKKKIIKIQHYQNERQTKGSLQNQ